MVSYRYPRPAFTVDAAVLCEEKGRFHILLIRRGRDPFQGMWALPGGFLEEHERVEDAVRRELKEETGLEIKHFSFVGLYDKPDRDPRGRTLSAVFLAILDHCKPKPVHGDDAAEARWFSLTDLPPLAFDHDEIVADVVAMLQGK